MDGRGHGDKRPRKWPAAAAALITTSTIENAAAVAGVNEKTLRAWLKDTDFGEVIRAAGRQVLEDAVRRLQGASTKAVATLVVCLDAEDAPDRIRAAVAILNQSTRGSELIDVLARLEALEAKGMK